MQKKTKLDSRQKPVRPDLYIDPGSGEMTIGFNCSDGTGAFDICDENGRVLQTGKIDRGRAEVDVSSLDHGRYILLIIDGDIIASHAFELNA